MTGRLVPVAIGISGIIINILLWQFLLADKTQQDLLTLPTIVNLPGGDQQHGSSRAIEESAQTRMTASTDANSNMLKCLKQVLWNDLPILRANSVAPKKKKNVMIYPPCPEFDTIQAHHGSAWDYQRWNKAVHGALRAPMALPEKDCTFWEVGANTLAADSREFLKTYGHCHFHAFEPIPDFFQVLQRNWESESRMTVYPFGLALEPTTFMVPRTSLDGEGTFIGDASTSNQSGNATELLSAKIESFDTALASIGGPPTVLHMNCEGCEWDLLPQAKRHGFLNKVKIINIGWHAYGKVGIGARAWQYCEIEQLLSETHTRVSGLPFGWERWILNENSG